MVAGMDDSGDGKAPRRTRLPASERRETILHAAADVFAEAGYRAAKVSDVAARVGVTEPVIFQNFGSKAALFAAVAQRAAAEVRASLDDLAAGFGSASGLLAHILAGSPHGAGAEHSAAAYGVLFAAAGALPAHPAGAPGVFDAGVLPPPGSARPQCQATSSQPSPLSPSERYADPGERVG